MPSRTVVRQDLKTIAGETTNDKKLLKTLHRKKILLTDTGRVQRAQKTRISKIPRCLLRRQDNYSPGAEKNDHYLTPQGTSSLGQFWWPELTEEIQNKCDECIPCKMAGKSNKPQNPMSEKQHLPPADKPNQETQLDFIGPIRFK